MKRERAPLPSHLVCRHRSRKSIQLDTCEESLDLIHHSAVYIYCLPWIFSLCRQCPRYHRGFQHQSDGCLSRATALRPWLWHRTAHPVANFRNPGDWAKRAVHAPIFRLRCSLCSALPCREHGWDSRVAVPLGVCGSPALATGGASYGDFYAATEMPYVLVLWGGGATLGPVSGPPFRLLNRHLPLGICFTCILTELHRH